MVLRPCLIVLKTDVLIVLLDAQRVTSDTTGEWDETKGCVELGFDQAVEAVKKRVVCIVRDKEHLVRTPAMRFVFDRGADCVEARHLILAFVKKHVPGTTRSKVGASGSKLALSSYTSE